MRSLRCVFFVWFLATLTVLAGCSSVPATSPTAPVELPKAIFFPRNLAIQVDKIRVESESSALSALVVEGPFSSQISFAPEIVEIINQGVDQFLQIIGGLEIPVSADLDNFGATLANEEGESANFKIDFVDFDLDGDGVKEGCSGHTAALPICMRIWTQPLENGTPTMPFTRFIATVFDAFPTEDNPGAGQIRTNGQDEDIFIGLAIGYDHEDPLAKSNDFFLLVQTLQDGGDPILFQSIHATVDQEGSDEDGKKLVKTSFEIPAIIDLFEVIGGVDFPDAVFRYIGQFLEGESPATDFWSGSMSTELKGSVPPGFDVDAFNFDNVCARISTATELSSTANCDDLGISVANEAFINLVEESDVVLPSLDQFPEQPPF